MEIINNNPFRILGIYSNSSAKDIASHISKAKALANVNKNAVFSEDMRPALPEFTRNTESLNAAQTKINLPADKLKYALFWFCNVSSIDGIALGHLQTGNVDKALELFGKQASYSSLINKGALILSQGDNLKEGIECIAKVIHDGRYRNAFVNTICGETFKIDEDQLSHLFIDTLLPEFSASKLLDFFQSINISSSDCDYLKAKTVGEPTAAINDAIAAASSISRDDASANYDAGLRLMNDTKEPLKQLKELLSETDVQYQRTADNLAKAILQCGINYHNNTDDDDDIKIDKAFELQNHALSIAVGKLTKDRCKQNVDILVEKKKKLPPKDVRYYDEKIKIALADYAIKADTISFAIALIKRTTPYLMSIKEVLGKDNAYYLEISTLVVNAALHNVIEEFNETMRSAQSQISIDQFSTILKLRVVFEKAWQATLYMDKLDMEYEFRKNRYDTNRNSLKDQVEELINVNQTVSLDMRGETGIFNGCRSLADYKNYLELFPDGKYASQAKKKITEKEVDEKKEDKYFNSCSSKSDYENYLAQYPNGRYRREAQNKIEEIKKRNKWITIIAIILGAILLIFITWGLEGLKVLGIVVGILLIFVLRAIL